MRKVVFGGALLFTGSTFALPLVNIDLSIGAMSHDPSGYVQYQGDKVDLKDDFGLDKKTKPFARAKIEIPIVPNLYLQYIPMEFKGRKNKSFTYGGYTFTGTVDTKVKVDHYDVGLYYNLPFIGAATGGLFDPEIGINVRILDFEGTVKELTTSHTESKSATIPVPMGYAGLSLNLPYVSLIGELRGITYAGNRYYDVTGEVRLKPISVPGMASLFIGVGYRYEQLKLDDVSDINADLKIKSLFANVGVSF
ncbi:outer membrane protein [Hydrogenivirga caldilitoris]|uniref:Outer membrane protein n=1 Tax=Hydrogenivirga caldilitoris TaxID=246264 RepID=A0A497XP33_9AQUI|nr:TIGR04219 family outer membrane beta-barrel protein [Hydrogenivirga caldilitoris]RLJ70628.1 outer membrane protein [Hydrogenivirga caldilitoris]